jgi:hypothetical protein
MRDQSIDTTKVQLGELMSFIGVTHRGVGKGLLMGVWVKSYRSVGKGLDTGVSVRGYSQKYG